MLYLRKTKIEAPALKLFRENQLSRVSIGISPLPHLITPFQRMCVRTSIAFLRQLHPGHGIDHRFQVYSATMAPSYWFPFGSATFGVTSPVSVTRRTVLQKYAVLHIKENLIPQLVNTGFQVLCSSRDSFSPFLHVLCAIGH